MVASEYLSRRTVVIVAALTLVLAVALIGFFPSYLISKVKQQEALTQSTNAQLNEDKEDLSAWLNSFNARLQALSAGFNEARSSTAMERVITARGSGITLTELDWSEEGGAMALSIVGVARDRQALLAFESRLNASGHFSGVSLPVSSLAKERDISFQINLSPK